MKGKGLGNDLDVIRKVLTIKNVVVIKIKVKETEK